MTGRRGDDGAGAVGRESGLRVAGGGHDARTFR